jgi:hypothetical protein
MNWQGDWKQSRMQKLQLVAGGEGVETRNDLSSLN